MSVRQEAHAFIDEITENKLIALKPLLCALADESIVIETDLTDEEQSVIAAGLREYEKNPGSFVSLEKIC